MLPTIHESAELLRQIAPGGTRVGGHAKCSLGNVPCIHIGPPVYRLHTRTTGCAGPIQLYRCGLVGDEVTRYPIAAENRFLLLGDGTASQKIRARRAARGEPETSDPGPHYRPDYHGRTCHGCDARKTETDRIDVAAIIAAAPYHAASQRIAAVACHFNPQNSDARRRCLATFRQQFPRIGLELFVAEGSTDGRWEVPDGPNVWRFALDPDAHLFCKENLLNLAIARLPDRFDRVLWIDSDVVIITPDYADRLAEALDQHVAVQGFAELRYIGANGEPQTGWRSSIGAVNARNGTRLAEPREAYPGLVWAMDREALVRGGGLYDRGITGGGDVAWCIGMYGDIRPRYARNWPPELVADIHRWASGITPLVPSVGYVPARAVHLYHGNLSNRQYTARNTMLRTCSYDPRRHLEYSPNGTLRWSAAAPAKLREAVRAYIHGRKEDS